MTRTILMAAAVCALAAGACKQEPEVAPDPETAQALERCQEAQEEKDGYIEELEKRLADLEVAGDAVVVRVEGDDLTISGRGPRARTGGGGAAGDADDAAIYEAFVKRTRGAREAITRCYQNALKNEASLQARTIQLEIEVDYRADGKVAGARFSPSIAPDFTRCMNAVTQRWEIPASPRPVTFSRKLTLTPE